MSQICNWTIFNFSWSWHSTQTTDRQHLSTVCHPGSGLGSSWRQSWWTPLDTFPPSPADPHNHEHGGGYPQRRPPSPDQRWPDPAAVVRAVRDRRLRQLYQPDLPAACRLPGACWRCRWVVCQIEILSNILHIIIVIMNLLCGCFVKCEYLL